MPRGDFRDFENVAAQSRGWIYDLGCEEQDSERSMCELTESRSLQPRSQIQPRDCAATFSKSRSPDLAVERRVVDAELTGVGIRRQ